MKFKVVTVYDENLDRMIKDVPKLQNYIDNYKDLCELIIKTDYIGKPYRELFVNFNNINDLIDFGNTFDKDVILHRKDEDEEYNTIEIYHTWRE